jgi:hypothetical protein
MNCFDWQNRTSEYLDGSLMGPAKREADEHLEGCESCNARYNHYRTILGSISSQPRAVLPLSIRKDPLSTVAATPEGGKKRGLPLRQRARKWLDLPWWVRIPIEAASIVAVIILAISTGPRIRALYERKIEKSLTEFGDDLSSGDTETAASGQLARGNVPAANAPAAPSAADDFSSGEGDSEAAGDNEEDDTPVVKAGSSETWRFNLKTDSPHDVRTKIVNILTDLKIPSNTPGLQGIEAPGGIQFDLIVPQAVIPDLKQALEKIAPAPPKELEDSPFGETFTWYKRKSKNPLAAGQTHVVIWLAQI